MKIYLISKRRALARRKKNLILLAEIVALSLAAGAMLAALVILGGRANATGN